MPDRERRLLEATLADLRRQMEKGFSSETAAKGFRGTGPTTGQCAAASVIAREVLGGDFASATVDSQSHWFNRLRIGGETIDVDLTGDQFGHPPIQVSDADSLYPGTRVRQPTEVATETLLRAIQLSRQAAMPEVAVRLENWLRGHTSSSER